MSAGRCPTQFLDAGDLLRLDDGTFAEVVAVHPLRRYDDPGVCRVELTYLTERGEVVSDEVDPAHEVMVWQTRTERLEAAA